MHNVIDYIMDKLKMNLDWTWLVQHDFVVYFPWIVKKNLYYP